MSCEEHNWMMAFVPCPKCVTATVMDEAAEEDLSIPDFLQRNPDGALKCSERWSQTVWDFHGQTNTDDVTRRVAASIPDRVRNRYPRSLSDKEIISYEEHAKEKKKMQVVNRELKKKASKEGIGVPLSGKDALKFISEGK